MLGADNLVEVPAGMTDQHVRGVARVVREEVTGAQVGRRLASGAVDHLLNGATPMMAWKKTWHPAQSITLTQLQWGHAGDGVEKLKHQPRHRTLFPIAFNS
jgi:hypothetical protein